MSQRNSSNQPDCLHESGDIHDFRDNHMNHSIKRRTFLAGGLGAGLGLTLTGMAWPEAIQTAQIWINQHDGTLPPPSAKVPHRKAKTTRLFKSPPGGDIEDARKNNQRATFPNALAIMTDPPGGLWIGEQKLSGPIAALYPGLPNPTDLTERAWLVDWNGKVLKMVETPRSRNTGGMAYGNGCIWRSTEYPGAGNEGIYQSDMDSRLISFHQMPLGPSSDGGGSHGALWQDNKLWLVSNRLRGTVRVDPETWTPEFFIPEPPNYSRFHAIAWDNGTIWQVAGNTSVNPAGNESSLIRYDLAAGEVIEVVDLLPGSCDPHGLAMHNGVLISCDAGNHPNWPIYASPSSGWIFRIDFI